MRFPSLVPAFVLTLAVALAAPAAAQSFQTKAGQAILVDHSTGTVLYQKNADERIPPASLAKLMTMEVVFDQLSQGRISLDETFPISEKAWREGGSESGGSTMFARLNSEVPVADLIRGVIIQSGNDASIALAEGVAGTEESFVRLMNERAAEIGMRDSTFRNVTGLTDPEQLVTLRDMVALARHLFDTYPDFYRLYSEREFTWNGIRQPNRNPLLGDTRLGVDGLKTGFTDASGYALVASAENGGERLFMAVSGLESSRDRERESRALLTWGTRQFDRERLFEPGEVVANARVYGGTQRTVPLAAEGAIDIFLPLAGRDDMEARAVYDGPIRAPIRRGDAVGVLRVTRGDEVTQETPLVAAEDVPVGPIYLRALDAAQEAVTFWR